MDSLDQMASALGITTAELNTTYMTLQRLVNYNQVGSGTQLNPKVVAGIGIPPVSNLRAVNLGALTGSSRIIVSWDEPTNQAVYGYNVFYSTLQAGATPTSTGTLISSVLHSPAIITVPPTTNQVISILVQTVAQSGSALDFSQCPSTTVNASSPNIVTSDLILTQIVNGNPPIFVNATWTNNSPSPGYIAWSNVTISRNGTVYSVADGNTNKYAVIWDLSSPAVFTATDLPFYPTANQYIVGVGVGISITNRVHLDAVSNAVLYSTDGNRWCVTDPGGIAAGDTTSTTAVLNEFSASFINPLGHNVAQISGTDGSNGGQVTVISADGTSNQITMKGTGGLLLGSGTGSACSFPTLDGSALNNGLSLSNCTIFGVVGALAGYILIKVNGTSYKIPIYNQV